ncbi:hypothetical protein DID88_001277 [Monilinia fructigena]|uniref:Uncharacterized protein n=1 Tax=Monilinia fructigena TaxID=38457 RepID=A0A395IYD5_9HELO|nr:hypothetical protein DID88_001277 [Monilinia fructigena]
MESYSPQPHERYPTPAREPSPLAQSITIDDITPNILDNGSTTNLATYLTSPNPAPALVRQLKHPFQTIQLAVHDDPHISTFQEVEGSFGVDEMGEVNSTKKPLKMTALMALWYLHMLARDEILPGQMGWKSEIGAPAEGTRNKILPKDEWIPEPQLAEKREAKRGRGWVWPEEGLEGRSWEERG